MMFVVTLPASAVGNPRLFALRAKKAGADLLEIRTDLTPHVKKFRSPLPIVLAVRGVSRVGNPLPEIENLFPRVGNPLPGRKPAPGDGEPVSDLQKQCSVGAGFLPAVLFQNLLKELKPAYIDVDLAEISHFCHWDATSQLRVMKRIVSHHHFESTPSLLQLQQIVERMLGHKPWAVKIATQIVTYKDLIVLMELQGWLRRKKIRSIILGMGDKAHLTRTLSPIRNALTYTFLDGSASSAEGQLPLSFYRRMPRVSEPAIFGIIGGHQIAKSLSPLIHHALFRKHKIDALFTMFPTGNFRRTLKELETLKIAGLCVTAPFKREAFEAASACDTLTKQLRSANTLVRSPSPGPRIKCGTVGGGEQWIAHNTDVAGFVQGYPFLSTCNSVAILGAGGVVPSVIEAIRQLNAKATITMFARNPNRAKKFLPGMQNFVPLRIADLHNAASCSADAVVCAITEDRSLPLPEAHHSFAIDLRYGTVTEFMKQAKRKDYHVYDGSSMLIHQALRQFEYFTGVIPMEVDATFLQSILAMVKAT